MPRKSLRRRRRRSSKKSKKTFTKQLTKRSKSKKIRGGKKFIPIFFFSIPRSVEPRSVERLVEGGCFIKHFNRSLQMCPLVERLIEGSCVFKHPVHIPHFGHVPIVERLVEGGCVPKHTSHTRHIGHVPIV